MSTINLPADLERRREDYGLITGRSHFVDDVRLPEGRPAALHMVAVRSPYAHAEIRSIEMEAARALPGVVAVFAGADLADELPESPAVPLPDLKQPPRKPLALERVRFVGDPVAVVLAESRAIAEDARDLVEVDYEPLPAVSDPEQALAEDAPLLYPQFGSNVALRSLFNVGDPAVFEQATQRVRLRLVNQRLVPASIETRGCLFDYDPASGQFTAWLSSQAVYTARDLLARALKLDRERVRVYNAAVGGAFGAKTRLGGEELVAALLALRLGRPVKWIEERSENLQAQTHGRGQLNEVEAFFDDEGHLLGLKLRTLADLGAYLSGINAMIPARTPHLLSGPYRLRALQSEVLDLFTNKVPTMAYRGAGRPEATYILERVMDRIAATLQLDPAEVRRRNLLAPGDFPYETITGQRYDSGNYQAALERALELADYAGWREKQRERRARGERRLLGIGLASFNEISGDGPPPAGQPREAATVRVRRNGSVLVQSAVSSNGQGHFTIFAQIAASVFNLPGARVEVQMNDSALPGFSIGTFGSRVTQMGASAVLLAAEAAREKALQVAAHVLEAAPADLTLEDGRVAVRGAPGRAVELGELARLVEERPELIENETLNLSNGPRVEGLAAWRDFAPTGPAFSSGTHVAVVEVDSETGEIEILRYVAVDDCGRLLNRELAEAQLHGGLAQGIGQALYEQAVYDQDGQLLTGTFQDYAMPLAKMLPSFTGDFVETPSPTNPLGAKGIGESGTIGAPPTVVNAVLDALAPLGISELDMPLTPEKVWAAIQGAGARG